MQRVGFTFLWMLVSFLVGCILFIGVIMAVNFKRAAQGDASSPLPNNRLVNLAIVYSLPTLALVLGAMGKLPGTRTGKPVPPVISTPIAPPVPPPPMPQVQTGDPKLSPEQVAAVLEKLVQQKFGQD